MDKGKVALNLDQLGSVTGGTPDGPLLPPAKYSVGDKVSLFAYPEYGVGVIKHIYYVLDGYECVVMFDKGTTTVPEDELSPA